MILTGIPDFLFGFATAIIIPLSSFLYKSYRKKKDLELVKKMIFKEYIDLFDHETEELSTETYVKYLGKVRDKQESLKRLLENEIKFMNSENQFKIIRMIEYTRMYLDALERKLNVYSLIGPFNQIGEMAVANIPSDVKDMNKAYKMTLNDYIILERDRFL